MNADASLRQDCDGSAAVRVELEDHTLKLRVSKLPVDSEHRSTSADHGDRHLTSAVCARVEQSGPS